MGHSHAIAAVWRPAYGMNVPRSAIAPPRKRVPQPAALPAAGVSDRQDEAARQDELARLIARMAAGDEAALAAFYDATVARAYGLALRIAGNPALAEEVVVDTYHQAWREARRFAANRGAPMAWLAMMCRSRALDALRARDPALLHDDPASLVADGEQPRDEDPQDLLATTQAQGALHAALAALTPAQRQMVALAFFRGMTHEEIAAHAALPLGTVKSQIRRALEVLRRTLTATAGAL
jgi:RNA polymerase sigma-70 factor (ECF subfamily)